MASANEFLRETYLREFNQRFAGSWRAARTCFSAGAREESGSDLFIAARAHREPGQHRAPRSVCSRCHRGVGRSASTSRPRASQKCAGHSDGTLNASARSRSRNRDRLLRVPKPQPTCATEAVIKNSAGHKNLLFARIARGRRIPIPPVRYLASRTYTETSS